MVCGLWGGGRGEFWEGGVYVWGGGVMGCFGRVACGVGKGGCVGEGERMRPVHVQTRTGHTFTGEGIA